ncbi:hypothetical protein J6590_100420 [Homalodisca vitripennis]|nr:hypothetical protein J6590_071373 [Homalodisca vitripennis]KAG8308819.1 hypothetical protein J6590_100420 [Homalodisca vitripennis]
MINENWTFMNIIWIPESNFSLRREYGSHTVQYPEPKAAGSSTLTPCRDTVTYISLGGLSLLLLLFQLARLITETVANRSGSPKYTLLYLELDSN